MSTKPAAATPASTSTSSSTSTGASTGTTSHTPLNKLVETPEFAWFSAHVLALACFVLGLLFRKGAFGSLLTKVFFLSEIASFGIILFNKYGTKVAPRQLLVDDNAHYLVLSLLWLLTSRRVFTTVPFVIYSLFHVLTYARAYLLPALGHPQTSAISQQIENFIKTRNNQFTTVAAQIELGLLIWLFVQLFTFRKANFVIFAIYAAFFRLRYAVSGYTRTSVHSLEVQVDKFANNAPPAAKDTWLKVKAIVAQIPGPSKVN